MTIVFALPTSLPAIFKVALILALSIPPILAWANVGKDYENCPPSIATFMTIVSGLLVLGIMEWLKPA